MTLHEIEAVVFSSADEADANDEHDAVPLTGNGSPLSRKHPGFLQRRIRGCGIPYLVVLVLFSGISLVVVVILSRKGRMNFSHTRNRALSITCHSPTIDRKSVVDHKTPLVPPGYKLVQATVHQRHLDRWMYAHSYIDNKCWSNQINSTDPTMEKQCSYNLSSVWESASFEFDPYSVPARGSCNPKQLTLQGKANAEALGEAYRSMFGNVKQLCSTGNIRLEADVAQKNQQSTQHVYKGICGSFPDPKQYPAKRVLDNGELAPGRPFFLTPGICDSKFYHKTKSEASKAFLESDWIPKMHTTAQVLAQATDKEKPNQNQDLATFLDNIEDCAVSHACHGLDDTPHSIWSVFDHVDTQETASRLSVLDFLKEDDSVRNRFVANYFGYYFVVLKQRMQQVVDNTGDAPLLYIQVTSDDRISLLLRVLNAPSSMTLQRPVWGSQVVFQLLQTGKTFHVRTLYNGVEISMQTWETFVDFVKSITPSQEDCSNFYDNIQS